MKLFNVIFGVYAIFGALYCMFWPESSFLNCGWIIAFLLGAWGVCAIVVNATSRKTGSDDRAVKSKGIVGLIIGVLAVVACILSLTTTLLGQLFMVIILVMFTGWMMIDGIITLVGASQRKKKGGRWVISLVFGIIVIVAGAFAVLGWALNLQKAPFFIGIQLLVFGIRLVFGLFDYDKISEHSKIW